MPATLKRSSGVVVPHRPPWRGRVAARGGRIVNVDASLIAEAPKMAPHIPAMKTHIAAALGLTPDRVGLKATTNERLGFVGRAEGIAALAVASIDLPE